MKPWVIVLADLASIAASIAVVVWLGLPSYLIVAGAVLPMLAISARHHAAQMLPTLFVLALIWPVTLAALTLRVAVGARRAPDAEDGSS